MKPAGAPPARCWLPLPRPRRIRSDAARSPAPDRGSSRCRRDLLDPARSPPPPTSAAQRATIAQGHDLGGARTQRRTASRVAAWLARGANTNRRSRPGGKAGRAPVFLVARLAMRRSHDRGRPPGGSIGGASAIPLAWRWCPRRRKRRCSTAACAGAVLQHARSPQSRPAGREKTEFPRPRARTCARRLGAARRRRRRLPAHGYPGARPAAWNRLRGTWPRAPAEIGLRGMSGYAPRPVAQPAPGSRRETPHVDSLPGHARRGFLGEEEALGMACRQLALGSDEPTGWLTHHAVQDAACWAFLERLFDASRRCGARWAHPAAVFLPASK